MYHKMNVDYAYLLWEDFVYQVENKNVKKSNEMYYPRFSKVIVNFFMTKDQSIPRWNSVNCHYARDDYMFTTIKVISRHEDTQLYGAIFPNKSTNEDIRNFESYKEYHAIASGAVPLKPKARVKKKQAGSDQAPKAPQGKRLKATSKKLDDEVGMNEDDDDNDDDNDDDGQEYVEQDDEDQDDDNEQTDSDNDGDDFVHPKFSTHDEEDKEEDSFDPRVQTPSHVESTDDESNKEIQGANDEGEEMDEEETNEEDKEMNCIRM
ncbi:hypothetical protein Tco_0277227 [Tanacetum coccineum]